MNQDVEIDIEGGESSGSVITCGDFSGRLENVSCPICTGPRPARLIYRKSNGVGIWLCPECDTMYASPRFTEESLHRIYESESFVDASLYDNWSYDRWKKENKNRSYVTQRLKIALIRQFLANEDRVLDVGCGTGLFCLEAHMEGLFVEGIDPSGMLTKIGREILHVPLHQGLLEDFAPGCKYRGIVIWDVLEHVYNPVAMLRKCHSLTEKGGYLFAQVPNHAGLSNRFKTSMCRAGIKRSDFKHFGFPWHLYSFNRRSLAALLRSAGYETVLVESWPHQLKEGVKGRLSKAVISMARRLCLTDYITCVGRRLEDNAL